MKYQSINMPDLPIKLPEEFIHLESEQGMPPGLFFVKETEVAVANIFLSDIRYEESIPRNDITGVVQATRSYLTDEQGLIEINTGKTKSGKEFVYSIVKNYKDDGRGVMYIVVIQIAYTNSVYNLQCYFQDYEASGIREVLCYELAIREGLVDTKNENDDGFFRDPYDPDYKKGILMNIAEERRFDEMFPEHSLSEARRFINAIISLN